MLRLALVVAVEIVVGLALAGIVLAVAVPVMVRRNLMAPGDLLGVLVIGIAFVVAIGAMLFRPGSGINRYSRRFLP